MVKAHGIRMSLPRLEASEKVRGRTAYVDDLDRAGMLHGAILGSPHAHARILSYDTSKARTLPGVVAVLTGEDVGHHLFGSMAADQRLLAQGKVRYVGDPVAAVAAVDLETAQKALRLIDIAYEELPAVFEPEAALMPGAPVLHEDYRSYFRVFPEPPDANTIAFSEYLEGDLERGWRESDVVVEAVYEFPAQQHVYMEPCGALAEVDGTGKIAIWSSTQSVFGSQAMVASALGIPMSRVRSIATHVGGGFGAKQHHTVQHVAAALALATGRPVKVVLPRDQDMAMMRSRHAGRIRMKTGAKRDGTLVTREADVLLDGGAYCEESPAVLDNAVMMSHGPYRIPHVRCGGRVVYTNKLRASAFRGFGNPQATFASESQMDELALALGMDPIELRLKNVMTSGDKWMGGQAVVVSSIAECLERVRAASAWERRRGRNRPPGGASERKRGIGVSCFMHRCAVFSTGAVVRLAEDGTVALSTGVVDLGQGSDTILAQICAETLALPLERINFVRPDTDGSPYDFGTAASRSTYMAGRAVAEAARQVRDQMFRHAGEMLECAVEDLELRPGGRIGIRGIGDAEVSFAGVAARSLYLSGGPITGSHSWFFQGEKFDSKRTQIRGYAIEDHGVFISAAQAVDVEVDDATGAVQVTEVWSAHDVGRALNPAVIEGQVQGGVVQGIGYALTEELVWDEGRLANPTLMDYKVPSALDVPYAIHPLILENPEPTGPFGARGVAELGIIGVAPAVANAVADATGVRVHRIPLTPERFLGAKG